jgi:hypothetical protein
MCTIRKQNFRHDTLASISRSFFFKQLIMSTNLESYTTGHIPKRKILNVTQSRKNIPDSECIRDQVREFGRSEFERSEVEQ